MQTQKMRNRGPRYHQRRIWERVHKDPALAIALEDRHAYLDYMAREPVRWVDCRSYEEHNAIFAPALRAFGLPGNELFDVFGRLRPARRPLRIFEEGAGAYASFATDLKSRLQEKSIDTEITILNAHRSKFIDNLKEGKRPDRVIVKRGEFYYPRKKQDVIVSVYGPLHYTISPLRKDHLLKLAHSLNKGGLLMARITVLEPLAPNPRASPSEIKYTRAQLSIDASDPTNIPWGVSEHPNPNRRLSLDAELRGVQEAFAKRGFRAQFFHHNLDVLGTPITLIVQRTNEPYRIGSGNERPVIKV